MLSRRKEPGFLQQTDYGRSCLCGIVMHGTPIGKSTVAEGEVASTSTPDRRGWPMDVRCVPGCRGVCRLKFLVAWVMLCMYSFVPQDCHAQARRTFADRILKVADSVSYILRTRKISTDTDYVIRPRQPWTIRLRYDLKRTYFSTDDQYDGQRYKYYFENDFNSSVGLSINYLGLSVSLSLNPKKVFRKKNDTELNFNYYNNKWGFDVSYSDIRRFQGSNEFIHLFTDNKDSWGDTHLKGYSANVYYVFNNRKFSYPAAFSHTWIQKRSAGSFITGISMYSSKADVDLSIFDVEWAQRLRYMIDEVRMKYVSVNFGYAFNFVPNRNWLLHASFVPGIMLWKDYTADIVSFHINHNGVPYSPYSTERWPKRITDYSGTLRLGVTHSWNKYFIGVTVVKQFENVGDNDVATMYGGRWKIRSYLGIRL